MKHDERAALVGRVRAYIEHPAMPDDALVLARWSLATDGTEVSCEVTYGDLRALCAEVERLERERDEVARLAEHNGRAHDEEAVQVNALRAEVTRLAADAKRLDYMDAQRNWTRWMGRDGANGSYTVWPVFGDQSFRAAIDAAMTGGTDAE